MLSEKKKKKKKAKPTFVFARASSSQATNCKNSGFVITGCDMLLVFVFVACKLIVGYKRRSLDHLRMKVDKF
jgi:hypothetical protein